MEKPKITTTHAKAFDQDDQDAEVFALLSKCLRDESTAGINLTAVDRKLAQRLQSSLAGQAGLFTVRARSGVWQTLTSGIRYKPLWQSLSGNSVLIEFAPGASLPVHKHMHLEEGVVLSGSLQVDDIELQQFDYHVSPPGSRYGKISSKNGGVAFLRGSSVGETVAMVKEVLGGFLPKNELYSRSVTINGCQWDEIQPGLFRSELWTDGAFVSQFYRMSPGAVLAGHTHPADEECMMLDGELFLGDILLQAGDYQVAVKGSKHGEIYTDTGALLYVRSAAPAGL
ncbi:MAG: hypothetical protein FJ190_06805 [Gammaproteobacteria bacterium]|nr:hypothetical protein [Gammaproteobacteria bacterium]